MIKAALLIKISDFREFEGILKDNNIEIDDEQIIEGKENFTFSKIKFSMPFNSNLMDKIAEFDNYPFTVYKKYNKETKEEELIYRGI